MLSRSVRWCAPLAAFCATALPASAQVAPETRYFDFSDPTKPIPLAPYSTPGGVPAAVDLKVADGALTLVNRAGGSFGVNFNLTPFNPDQLSHLAFDYKIGPDTKIDFFLRVNGKYHGIGFTGPAKLRPGSIFLGHVPKVQADRQWHRAVLPIRDWLRSLYPMESAVRVDELILGNWNNEGYLMAGIGANGPGATWSLDNLALLGTTSAEKVAVTIPGSTAYSLDGGPKQKTGDFKTASPGFHVITGHNAKGEVANSVPVFVARAPQPGTPRWQGNEIVWPVEASGGVNAKEFRFHVNEKAYGLDSPHLTWDVTDGEFRLNAAQAGNSWKDGDSLSLALEDSTGIGGLSALSSKAILPIDFSKHENGPAQVQIKLEGVKSPGTGTFESSLEQWQSWEVNAQPGAIVERIQREDARPENQYAVRLTCPRSGTPFGTRIRGEAFDAAQFPVLTFEYKASDRVRLDFRLSWGGTMYSIRFLDRDTQIPRLGALDNITADGRWRRAEIPLYDWMKRTRPDAPSYVVDNLAIADDNWLGNARGVQIWFDNFQFLPRIAAESASGTVTAADITGLKGISWSFDTDPNSIPDTTADGVNRFQVKGSGRQWLHIRAQNGAGHWSPAVHLPIILEQPATPLTAEAPK